MSMKENQHFLFSWKLENLRNLLQRNDVIVQSPIFRIVAIANREWSINLRVVSWKDGMTCQLQHQTHSKNFETISICYQYELINSTGISIKSSDILSNSFCGDGGTYPYALVPFQDLKLIGDVNYLQFRLKSRPNTFPMTISSCPAPAVNCEAETEIFFEGNIFKSFYLEFKDQNKWSAVQRFETESIPVKITFKYIYDELRIDLFSLAEDDTYYGMFCSIRLLHEKLILREKKGYFQFNNLSKLWKFPTFIGKRDLEKALCFAMKEIRIQILVECTYKSKTSKMNKCKEEPKVLKNTKSTQNKDSSNCFLHLRQDLRNMFIDKAYADVKLRADEDILLAHRCVLAARSPVFRAMFDQDMLESKTGTIDIIDIESKIVNLFLEYLYTGSVDGIDEEIALSLLIVADKYQVSSLAEKCSTFLKSVLSFGNVLNILKVADMVNQDLLKLSAIEYIVENSTKVLSTPEWPQYMKVNPTLVAEVFLKLSKKFDSTS